MKYLSNRHIILGVSGGIAAYKALILLRLLVKAGADVRVVMTRAAKRFIGKTSFAALSGQPVYDDVFENDSAEGLIRHIDWADWADAVVIAPATANIIGKFASGIADDALSTFLPAVAAPVMICPSMNTQMYQGAAVQRNLKQLAADGHTVLTPGAGELACGTYGPGRLPEPEIILDRLNALLAPKDFTGKKLLVTAGPTREAIDPVRFISNPSSGKMGYAVARAAEYRGAEVVLISGPTHLPAPHNVERVLVVSAADMAGAVLSCFEEAEIIIKTAAVADFKPTTTAGHKIKKKAAAAAIELAPTVDILKTIGARKGNRFLVGFAAETQALRENAGEKLRAKQLDMIVGNLVNIAGSGFGGDTNQATVFFADAPPKDLPRVTKMELADTLLDIVAERLAVNKNDNA